MSFDFFICDSLSDASTSSTHDVFLSFSMLTVISRSPVETGDFSKCSKKPVERNMRNDDSVIIENEENPSTSRGKSHPKVISRSPVETGDFSKCSKKPVERNMRNDDSDFQITRYKMVCSFLVPVVDNYDTVLNLPPCYDMLRQKHNFPVLLAFLSQIGGDGWLVDIVNDSNQYSFTGNWKNAAIGLKLKVGDLIVFKFLDGVDFNIDIIRKDKANEPLDTFHISFTSDRECMMLASEHLSQHFENNNLHKPFTLRFGAAKWLVQVENRFNDLFLNDEWEKLFQDLKLQVGYSLVFKKFKQTTFTIQVFLQDGTGVQPDDSDSNIPGEIIYIYSDESETDDIPAINPGVQQDDPAVEEDEAAFEVHDPPEHPMQNNDEATFSEAHMHVNDNAVEQDDPAIEGHDAAVVVNEANIAADFCLNSTADEDPTVIKQLTHKFRFPIWFGQKAEFFNGAEVNIKFGDGNIIKETIRSEVSGNQIRFVVCKWASCMQKLGIRNGNRYRIKYYKNQGLLAVYHA